MFTFSGATATSMLWASNKSLSGQSKCSDNDNNDNVKQCQLTVELNSDKQ